MTGAVINRISRTVTEPWRYLQSEPRKLPVIAGYLAMAGAFSVPLAGAALQNLLLGLAILVILFSRKVRQYPQVVLSNWPTRIAFALFVWLSLSLLWTDVSLKEALGFLNKYRELVLLPLFMIIFSHGSFRKVSIKILYVAILLTLVVSVAMYYGYDKVAASHAFGFRIFKGITISLMAYLSLVYALNNRKYLPLFVVIYLFAGFYLFVLEKGRSGYLCFAVMTAVFIWHKWRWKGALIGGLLITMVAIAGSQLVDIRIFDRAQHLMNADVISLEVLQKTDNRLEFYVLSWPIFANNWLLGVGIGAYGKAYEAQMALQPAFWGHTVNPHSEYVLLACQAGVMGLMLFLALLLCGLFMHKGEKESIQFRQAVFILIATACLFNSSILDHREGTLFLLLMALSLVPYKSSAEIKDCLD